MNELLRSLDAAVTEKVLIFGSIPPEARDLDLLVQPTAASVLRQTLVELGFHRQRDTWARFRELSAEVVDLVPAKNWQLPSAERERLFADAVVLDGYRHLAVPASHDIVLIAALRATRSGRLDDKRRARVARALEEDPAAWGRAGRHAAEWRAEAALKLLQRMYAGEQVAYADRSAAVAEILGRGRSSVEARARALKHMSRRSGRGHVIALSGLDGAGKSTQAAALVDSLQKLGYDAVTEWTRLAQGRSLDRIAEPVKALLRSLRPGPHRDVHATGTAAPTNPRPAGAPDRGWLVTFIWSHLVALENARAHRRAVIEHLRAGRVVVCDRYVLDSHVHLRRKYPELRSVRSQAALVRLLSPPPLRSYLLYIDADESTRRKKDVYTRDQLERHARLYLEILPSYATRLIDGTRRSEDIAAQLAREVWVALES